MSEAKSRPRGAQKICPTRRRLWLPVSRPAANVLTTAPSRDPVTVAADAPLVETVRLVSRYNLLAIPVIETRRHVIGIVTVDNAVDTLIARQHAQVQHFGGMEPLEAPYLRIGFLETIRKREAGCVYCSSRRCSRRRRCRPTRRSWKEGSCCRSSSRSS